MLSRLLQPYLWWQPFSGPAPYTESAPLSAPLIWTLGLYIVEFCGVLVEQKMTVIHRLQSLKQQDIKVKKVKRPGISLHTKVEQMCCSPWLIHIPSRAVHSLINHVTFSRWALWCGIIQLSGDKHWFNTKIYRKDCSFWIPRATVEYWWKVFFKTYLFH